MLYPVILAGGIGTRLWPLSRSAMPKQFVAIAAGQSLLESTLNRLHGLQGLGPVNIVCNIDHRFLVAQQLEQRKQSARKSGFILLEPVSRNTAPAIALAAMTAFQQDVDASLLVLPADHLISDNAAFQSAVKTGYLIAQQDSLVTFGIVPTGPETGYGYIKRGDSHKVGKGFEVAKFVEKPDLARAQAYLASGEYCWNSGMFLFKAKSYLSELERLAPDIYSHCECAFKELERDIDFLRIPEKHFEECRSESIDYAVMEKTNRAVMVPLETNWSDLGSWDAMWKQGEKDIQGNMITGDVFQIGARNSYLHSTSRLLAVLGLDNTVVVETPDAVLVAEKQQAQQVKMLVQELGAQRRKEKDHHSLVYRPWGMFESLAQGSGFQVKHIVVNPGSAISLQRHQHRSEHWTVVKGKASIYIDGREFCLEENESTFVPQGSRHRLSNHGELAVEIIEVQVGEYLGEDDIERFEDLYGR
ncbi:MAG: mannose-1-phosphate guanylyltransferase/mannose-6-phosphate isomerase [Gammaproteobacteria bacterium]|nr:mannose-1-phosphate guanylyltransferase/mannose-6-phosphate isomerase [Gammaproteobacteria bacterium]MCY4356248.1 mannose-1-phosphate guanylyltransferase/mannose-6-phosphate isomerase [Gammaproteobacteria bacterium]